MLGIMLALLESLATTMPGPAEWGRLAGRLHPAVVHFPIALILVAAAAETVSAVRRARRPSTLGLQCLSLGALAAIVAAALGWIGADADPPGSTLERTLFIHRWSGVEPPRLDTNMSRYRIARIS